MKKRFFIVLGLCLCLIGSTPVWASNHTDTAMPTKFISYTTSVNTGNRSKTDDSSVYIKNNSGMNLWVCVKSASNVNCTYDSFAIVAKGEWLIHNTVYEDGYRSCHLNISTANVGVSGTLSGYWSPDSVGKYDYANPF